MLSPERWKKKTDNRTSSLLIRIKRKTFLTFWVEVAHVPGLQGVIGTNLDLELQDGVWESLKEELVDGHIEGWDDFLQKDNNESSLFINIHIDFIERRKTQEIMSWWLTKRTTLYMLRFHFPVGSSFFNLFRILKRNTFFTEYKIMPTIAQYSARRRSGHHLRVTDKLPV